MKKYLILIPILLIVVSLIAFFMNKNSEIHKAEKELVNLKELSFELKKSFEGHIKLIDTTELYLDNDRVVTSTKTLRFSIDNYLETLNNLSYDRLYRVSKIISEKSIKLENIYENIKTDKAVLNNSIIWSINSYESYMKNKKRLTSSDRFFMTHLFKATLGKSSKGFVALDASKKVDTLNSHLRMIQTKNKTLLELKIALEKNSIIKEINQVILFSFQQTDHLREEIDSLIQILLLGSTVLLIFSLGIYAREIKALSETKKLKSELTEYAYALNNSSIVSKSDLKGNITFVNDKFCEISGYEREELIGKPHSIVRHPDTESSIFETLWDDIKYGDIFQGTIKNKTKEGEAYYVETTIIPLHNDKGTIDEYLSVRHDVTQFMAEKVVKI